MELFDLAFIWAGIIAFAVLTYVVLDGFDLGIGILFPFAPEEHDRDTMMNSVAVFRWLGAGRALSGHCAWRAGAGDRDRGSCLCRGLV